MQLRFTATDVRSGNDDVPGTRLFLHVVEPKAGVFEATVEGPGFEAGRVYEVELREVTAATSAKAPAADPAPEAPAAE